MTLQQMYLQAKERLSGMESAGFDAACIMEKHTGFRRSDLPLIGGQTAENVPAGFWRDISRRAEGEPLQYILEEWEFYGLRFKVGRGVLIPRPETEILAETAIAFLKPMRRAAMLELCAGSGCVSITVAKNAEDCSVCCLELSKEAVHYLKENIRLHGLDHRIIIQEGDMLNADTPLGLNRSFDVIVCNPPYIASADIEQLQREVRFYEPRCALDGGEDGLVFYRAFALWKRLLKKGGMAAFEVGAGQAGDVAEILRGIGLSDVFIKKDYAGIDRVVGGFVRSE